MIYLLNDHKCGFVMTGTFSRRFNLLKIRDKYNNLIQIENKHMYKFWNINNSNNKYIIVIRHPKEVIISGYLYHKKCNEPWAIKKGLNYYDDWLNKNHFIPEILDKNKELITNSYFSKDKPYQEILNSLEQNDGIKYEMNNVAKNTLMGMHEYKYYNNSNVLIIKFEDLIFNLKNQIINIFKFLEIENEQMMERFWSKAKQTNLLVLKKKKKIPEHVTNNNVKNDRYKDYWNKTIDDCFYKIYPKDILSKFNYED